MSGWIKLHRKTAESRVFLNEGLLKVWVWCLLKASHSKQWVDIKTGRGITEVEILPGQFIFGRHSAAKKLKMKADTVYSRMKKLEKMKNINMQNNTHYSIITIINWEVYQGEDEEIQHRNQHPNNTQTPTKHQPNNTYKNVKNVKNDKNVKIYSDEIKNFTTSYQEYVLTQFPKTAPKISDSLIEKCCDTIDKLIRLDDFSFGEVYETIQWASKDDFWSNQILSLSQLRKKSSKNGNTKFVNIYTSKQKRKLNPAEKRLQQNINVGMRWLNEK